MKIGQYKMANEWMREESATPEEALNTWNEMEAEFKANRAMSQEPRSMDLAALSDDVVPGRLKDELAGNFDPSQETYEEYLQRINLERPFNMAEGGQLVKPSVDGSRPGYGGFAVKFENTIKPKIYEGNRFTKKMPPGTYSMRLYEGEKTPQGTVIEKTYVGTKKQLKKIFDKKNRGRVKGDVPVAKDGEVYKIRQGKNKGKFSIRMPKEDTASIYDKKTQATKHKRDYLNDPANKVGGSRDIKRKIPKNHVTGKTMLEAAKKKNIFVGKGRDPNNFATVFDFPKTTVKGKNFYDISKLNDEKAVDTILEAQVRSGSGTDYAKKKFPVKTKYSHTKKRVDKIVEEGGWGKNDPWAGKRGSGVQLGHGDDFWAGRRITPQNLLYTPSEINKLMGDKGMLDDKIHAVYEKQEFGKLTKKGDELKKFLNETDATLTRLAGQSGGFKQVTLSDGGVFGGQRLSVDLLDEFPGWSQKETIDFVNKWKDKETWNTVEEFNNIKKAKLFEVNRKAAYDAALKMSQEEKTKIMSKIRGEDFNKHLSPKHQQLIKNQWCPDTFNKGGGAGTCPIGEAMDNMIKKTNAVKQGVIKGTEATRIANKASKVARFGTGKGLAAVLGPIGLAGEAVFEVALAAPGYARGESGKRLLGDSILGLIPGVGQSAEEEFDEYATKAGMSELEQQKIKNANRFIELEQALVDMDTAGILEGKGAGRGGQHKGINKFMKLQEEYIPLYNQFVGAPPSESLSTMFAEQDRINQTIEEAKATRRKQRQDSGIVAQDDWYRNLDTRGYAGGGIAGIRRPHAIPPKSGPTPQGLPSMYNRVKRI